MKILAQITGGSFDANKEAAKAIEEIKALRKGTTAEGMSVSDNEVYLQLAGKFPSILFMLLDNNDCIVGIRNSAAL